MLFRSTANDLNCTGCVSAEEVGADVATQAELDSHKASGDHDARYVDTNGDTMTGALILSGNPTAALGAATKQYVDSQPRSNVRWMTSLTGTTLNSAGVWIDVAGSALSFDLSVSSAVVITYNCNAGTNGSGLLRLVVDGGVVDGITPAVQTPTAGSVLTVPVSITQVASLPAGTSHAVRVQMQLLSGNLFSIDQQRMTVLIVPSP